jgi:uncharacterized membrane protein YqiK
MGLEGLVPFLIVFGSVAVGLFLLVFLIVIFKSYVKAPANRAFVRTGGFQKAGKPPLVVMNGGAWVFKVLHEITWVDLGTMAIEIERAEENALLTIDPQYADIKAIFYIKVEATSEGISRAARTIGAKEVNVEAVKQLVDAKLDGALRDMAASFTLMGLHQEREKFIEEVQTRLKSDLDENGLSLESVSILTLKAARQGTFPTDDVFGAQVARANAQVIQVALRERNDIERQTEVDMKQRNVSTEKEKLSLDQDLAFATADQTRQVRVRESLEKTTADKTIYEQEQAAEQARIAKERQIKLTEIEMEQTILVEDERKTQEYQTAELARNRAIDVAEQEKQVAILKEQQKREAAERERLVVAAQREEAAQALLTVEEKAQAEREAQIQIIQANRDAERTKIERQNEIEINALKQVREAEAKASALKQIADAEAEAALKQAETMRTQAQAESDAEKMHAEATKATVSAQGLAEADVIRARAKATESEAQVIQAKGLAEAESTRARGLAEAEAIKAKGLSEAEGQKAKAEALAAFDNVSQRLELERIRLEAQIQIEVARAQAMGQGIANMQVKLFGSSDMAEKILKMASFTGAIGDMAGDLPQPIRQAGQKIFDKIVGDGNGSDPSTAQIADLAPQLVKMVVERLDAGELGDITVGQALDALDETASGDEKTVLVRARQLLDQVPFIGDVPFETVYKRYLSGEA